MKFADAISDLMYRIAGWLLIGLGAFATLGALGGLSDTLGTADMFAPMLLLGFAVVFISSGVLVNPSFRQRLNRRRDPSRFGRIQTVDNRTFDSSENREETCVSCESAITEGLVRRYREEYAVGGIPVWTVSESHNYYCAVCATAELSAPFEAESNESLADRELDTEPE